MEALARRKRLSAREEELLGLLAGFPDCGGGEEHGSDRELSFSDLVEAGARPDGADSAGAATTAPRKGHEGTSLPGRQEPAASSKQQQQAARERRQSRRRSGGGVSSRGSCGGGADGVLLNFYVPGLLTRSMTAPRPGRGALPTAAVEGAPAKATAGGGGGGKTRASLGIGCWPALWGRDRRRQTRAPA